MFSKQPNRQSALVCFLFENKLSEMRLTTYLNTEDCATTETPISSFAKNRPTRVIDNWGADDPIAKNLKINLKVYHGFRSSNKKNNT